MSAKNLQKYKKKKLLVKLIECFRSIQWKAKRKLKIVSLNEDVSFFEVKIIEETDVVKMMKVPRKSFLCSFKKKE